MTAAVVELSHDEQLEIDGAEYGGEGWVLAAGALPEMVERLATKGLVRCWQDRWQLTPVGFSYTKMFEGRS